MQDPVTGLDKLSRTYAWDQGIGGGIGGLLSITAYQADGATPDKTYLPLYDGGGNVTGLVDAASGAVVATYEYDPFGNTLSATGDQAARSTLTRSGSARSIPTPRPGCTTTACGATRPTSAGG